MTELEQYYNKFCEEKRLGRRHGQVEYQITMNYIHKYLESIPNANIIDIGAGTGSVSIEAALARPDARVYAFEQKEEGCRLIRQNMEV